MPVSLTTTVAAALAAAFALSQATAFADDRPTTYNPDHRVPEKISRKPVTDSDPRGTSYAPQSEVIGSSMFVTGGIGDNERAQMEAVKRNYNLYVTNATTRGEFVGDAVLTVRGSRGETLIQTPIDPLFYAKLPPGTYTVSATTGRSGGQTREQRVVIRSGGAANVHLSWK